MAPEDSPSSASQGSSGQKPDRRPRRGGPRSGLSGVSPPDGDVAEVRQALLPAVAIASSDGECAGQGQGDYGSTRPTEAAHASSRGRVKPGSARLGQLLPLGKLNAGVHPDRQLRPPAPRAVRQQETRQERAAMDDGARLRLVQRAWSAFAHWVDSMAACCDSCDVNIVGEPDEGKP